MPTSFFVNAPSLVSRAPRKFSLSRHSRTSTAIATIILPILCLSLFILPHLNFSSLTTLSASSVSLPTHDRPLTDNDLEAAARRARPLPLCATQGKRATTFLMVFMGHSGSTAIISELRQHSQMHIERSELVDHQQVFNTTAAIETIKAFFDKGISRGKTPGFKIRPAHILNEPEQFRQLVEEYNTRILWQYRQNIFKASVGEYATRYLNDSRSVEGLKEDITQEEKCNHEAGCTFRIDDIDFLHDMLKSKMRSHHLITSAVNELTESTGCVREVPYEDYLYDREAVMRDVQRFLGLRYEETQPQRFKATGDSMCEVVENWDAICTAFYGCMAWQHMMVDARNRCYCQYTTGPVQYCNAGK